MPFFANDIIYITRNCAQTERLDWSFTGGQTRTGDPRGMTRDKRRETARHELAGEWKGWRIAGRRLIGPHGEWVTPELLDRWLYQHAALFRYARKGQQEARTRLRAGQRRG